MTGSRAGVIGVALRAGAGALPDPDAGPLRRPRTRTSGSMRVVVEIGDDGLARVDRAGARAGARLTAAGPSLALRGRSPPGVIVGFSSRRATAGSSRRAGRARAPLNPLAAFAAAMNSAVLMLPWANCVWIAFAKSKNAVRRRRSRGSPRSSSPRAGRWGRTANRFAGSPSRMAGASSQSSPGRVRVEVGEDRRGVVAAVLDEVPVPLGPVGPALVEPDVGPAARAWRCCRTTGARARAAGCRRRSTGCRW